MRWLCWRSGPRHPSRCCLLSKGWLTLNHQMNLPVGKSSRATWRWGKSLPSTVQKHTCTSTTEARMRERSSLWLTSPFTHALMALTGPCTAQVTSFWTSRMFLKQSPQMGSKVSLQPSESLGISTLIYPAANHRWHCSDSTLFTRVQLVGPAHFLTQVTANWDSRGPHVLIYRTSIPRWGVTFWVMWEWELMFAGKLVGNVQEIKKASPHKRDKTTGSWEIRLVRFDLIEFVRATQNRTKVWRKTTDWARGGEAMGISESECILS